MKTPEDHPEEHKRLEDLDSYNIMDSETEKDFDNLTKLAAQICGTSVSLVSLLDDKRQWFKSHYGTDLEQTPKEHAFCAHAINEKQRALIVNDAKKDDRFHDNPLVTGEANVSFYAGVPLISEQGYPLGTLCVIDDEPKELSEDQIEALKILSTQVMNLIELRKKKKQLAEQNALVQSKNKEIERFAYRAAHDLKSPIRGILGIIDLQLADDKLDEQEVRSVFQLMKDSSNNLLNLIEQLLEFSKVDRISEEQRAEVKPEVLVENLESVIIHSSDYSINLHTELDTIKVNVAGVNLVLQNLVTNSIKYGDKDHTQIDIGIADKGEYYQFYVEDNGPGIDPEGRKKVFEPFEILSQSDKFGNKGTGLGLASVKKAVGKMGGSIWLDAEKGEGAKFNFTVGKSKIAALQ